MGKVLGIVAEYNPFHNGHLFHLEESKRISGASYSIAIISGNFTQRGDSALLDKWSRAESAISCGVDLVIELPTLYATSSAENFSDGAVKILNSLNVVDYLSFGSEVDDINILDTLSDILHKEPKEYSVLLKEELKKGLSFPKARSNALLSYLKHNPEIITHKNNNSTNSKQFDYSTFLNAISSPNSILGIEYLKALKKHNSKIQPITVKRYGANYNDLNYSENIASATAIRNIIKNDNISILQKLLPPSTYSSIIDFITTGHIVPDLSVFEKQIIYNLRTMSIQDISNLPDVSEGLENTIKTAANSCNSLIDFLNICKSKRYTTTRLQRILLYSLLKISKKDMEISKKIKEPYIRVLGFNKRGKFLISEISKANPKLHIITSVKKFVDNNSNRNLKRLLDIDINSTNIYTLGYTNDSWSNLDFTKKIIIK